MIGKFTTDDLTKVLNFCLLAVNVDRLYHNSSRSIFLSACPSVKDMNGLGKGTKFFKPRFASNISILPCIVTKQILAGSELVKLS